MRSVTVLLSVLGVDRKRMKRVKYFQRLYFSSPRDPITETENGVSWNLFTVSFRFGDLDAPDAHQLRI